LPPIRVEMKHTLLIIFLVLSANIFGQKLNYAKTIDLNKDGIDETVNLYDEYNAEFEETEFTIFELITQKDTFQIKQDEVFVVQKEIYKQADQNIDNRFGILYESGKSYLWLTGFQYGCCLNKTVILEFTGNHLKEVMNENFQFEKIENIENQRYFFGQAFLSQPIGNEFFDIVEFQPKEYRTISKSFSLNKELSAESALNKYRKIEKNIDPYNCELLCLRDFDNECFLISAQKSNELMDRDFGITSLIKLKPDYFNHLPKEKLRIIRNELFAYNGYKFNSEDLTEYFESKNWYNPTEKNADEIYQELTEIERFNIKMIKELEE